MWYGNIKQQNQSSGNGREISEGSQHYHQWKNCTHRTGLFVHISGMQRISASNEYGSA
jgi:hypothetical protein